MSSSHPITPVSTYVTIFFSLLVLTGITVWVAGQDFGALNTPIALTVAVIKATLVVWYFMGLRYNTPLIKVTAVAGFLWLFIMFGITMSDYISRPWLGVPGR
jgi:cytochrome c oxidase subunit IV